MTEQQLLRQAKRRLAILRHAEEVTGNVAQTCRYYGISRQCFYKWQRRYEAGDSTVSVTAPAGRTPARWRPRPTSSARSSTCASTTTSGRRKISMYLKRYHDIAISNSGVWRILKRLELSRLPANQRHKTL